MTYEGKLLLVVCKGLSENNVKEVDLIVSFWEGYTE